jgi:hypothetical protein
MLVNRNTKRVKAMTYTDLVSRISNIRYGAISKGRGTVIFDYNGCPVTITEPQNVLLVGFDHQKASEWIAVNYGFLLANQSVDTLLT